MYCDDDDDDDYYYFRKNFLLFVINNFWLTKYPGPLSNAHNIPDDRDVTLPYEENILELRNLTVVSI